ncbi:unnamed protein product [Coregonus sp. 'balchen']|nr:unnamed protein product [Coregonus sp. 'balchen']
MVSWEVDGVEVKHGVLTTTEEEKGCHFSRSSTLTLSKARCEDGEVYTCTTTTPVIQPPSGKLNIVSRDRRSNCRILENPHMVLVLETLVF